MSGYSPVVAHARKTIQMLSFTALIGVFGVAGYRGISDFMSVPVPGTDRAYVCENGERFSAQVLDGQRLRVKHGGDAYAIAERSSRSPIVYVVDQFAYLFVDGFNGSIVLTDTSEHIGAHRSFVCHENVSDDPSFSFVESIKMTVDRIELESGYSTRRTVDDAVSIVGYLKDGYVHKISAVYELSYGVRTDHYYFDGGRLVYLRQVERIYPVYTDGSLNHDVLNYAYSGDFYFNNGALVWSQKDGSHVDARIQPVEDMIGQSLRYVQILMGTSSGDMRM